MVYHESNSDFKNSLHLLLRIKLLILFSIFAHFISVAQEKADIGLMGGMSYYIGDVNPSKHFYNPKVLYSGFYRYNLNKRYALKANFSYTHISGSDGDFSSKIQMERNSTFASTIYDFSAVLEHNFWPYLTTLVEEDRYTPYIFAGISSFYLAGDVRSIFFGIPFGAGFKFNFNKRFGIGIEYSLKKLFTDKIDGNTYKNSDYNFNYTKDWYSFTGFFISYKIFSNKINCPAYNN